MTDLEEKLLRQLEGEHENLIKKESVLAEEYPVKQMDNLSMLDRNFKYPEPYEDYKSEKPSPLKLQAGGTHYKNLVIQPIEFCQLNNLNMIESCVIKYVCRHKKKGGAEDIRKAIHMLECLLELEYKGT